MPDWEPVIGLEVHAHLKTRTKMFCRCELEYGAAENTRTCPVCLAHPGALPVANERAIEHTIKLGLALGCQIAGRAVFARKNYFEPDLRSADEALRYLRLLRQTIVELGVSDAEMEKGTMRADVNVSVRERGEDGFRPRWELKNMNSFTFIGRGIEAALRQQIALYERGETIEQSTYDYDADTDRLTVHRSKEEADDYRYFPEPDLVPVEPPAELVARLRGEVPEGPGVRIRALEQELSFDVAYALVTTERDALYAGLAAEGVEPKLAANWVMNEFAATGDDPAAVNVPGLAAVLKT